MPKKITTKIDSSTTALVNHVAPHNRFSAVTARVSSSKNAMPNSSISQSIVVQLRALARKARETPSSAAAATSAIPNIRLR